MLKIWFINLHQTPFLLFFGKSTRHYRKTTVSKRELLTSFVNYIFQLLDAMFRRVLHALSERDCVFNFSGNRYIKIGMGERPTILDSHCDKVLKDFIDQKRDEKMYKKFDPIFRCTTPSTGKRLGEVVVGTLWVMHSISCSLKKKKDWRSVRCGLN